MRIGGGQQFQAQFGIALAAHDVLGGDLFIGDRVVPIDALRDLAIGDRLDFQRVHATEISDLREGQRGFVNQPNCGSFGHQG